MECNLSLLKHIASLLKESIGVIPGADPGFHQGGTPDCDRPKLPTVCSSVVRVKQALFSVGSGACLRAQKLLGISLLNMHSLHLGVPFYTIFEIIKY